MLERQPPPKYVPLRVRFRSPAEQPQLERQTTPIAHTRPLHDEPLVPDLTDVSEAQRRTQQIKELVRLSDLLRADLGLEEVLRQIAASTAACTGFRILSICLIDEQTDMVTVAVCAGLSEEAEQELHTKAVPLEVNKKFMAPEFRISQSYFIPHEHTAIWEDVPSVVTKTIDDYEPGGWHPEDALMIPLYSPREQRLLGFLWLDDPEDGKIPTEESIEVSELFAYKAAIAIDNARLFQVQEEERIDLEQEIAHLRDDLEHIQRGNLYRRVQLSHQKLQPVADAINTMLDEVCLLLKSMQMVTQAVDEHTRSVQHSSELLVHDTSHQEHQVRQISQIIGEIAHMMGSISQGASVLGSTATDAVALNNQAQATVDRAVDGMSKVREATQHSARTMKSLSESGQEIDEMVSKIQDLSTRLHLLALNAAIEATRSGDYGQGFAVVAREMRALATDSAEAARSVKAYIRTFQYETNAVSHSVEQSTQHVVMQTELVTQTGIALEAISRITEQLNSLIQGIVSTSTSQEYASQLVTNAVGEIFRVTGNITEHMQEMQQSMSHLVDLTDSLRVRMSAFRLSEQS